MMKKIDMMQKVDLGKEMHFSNPKLKKDETKIKQFFDEKSSYYKKLQPKNGVWKTNDQKDINMRGPITSVKVPVKKAPIENTTTSPEEKKDEDILFDFTSVAKAVIPILEKRADALKR